MCAVFKIPPPEDADKPLPPTTGPMMVKKLEDAGLHVKLYQSVGRDEIYCLIGADESRLEDEADRVDLDLLMESQQAIDIAYVNGVRLAKHTKERNEMGTFISEDIWQNIYGPFDREPRKKALFKIRQENPGPHEGSVFRDIDRINLTQSIVEAPVKLGGAHMSINRISKEPNSQLLGFFPLHDPVKRKALKESWDFWGIYTPAPLEAIRDYFGEKVALYFSFLQFYTRMLLIPSLFGVCFFIAQLSAGNVGETRGLWFYAFVIIAWTTCFCEFWKRKESTHRVEWGQTNFAHNEQPRPDFTGEWLISPIDGRVEPYFPTWNKVMRVVVAQSIIFVFIAVVLISAALTLWWRNERINNDPDMKYYGAILNAVQIQIFNILYGKVSLMLNEWENHRTDSDWENALIGKSFLFKFVNSYTSLFYIAFFKPTEEGSDSLYELSVQLGIVFLSLIIINNTMELVVPWLMSKYNSWKEGEGVEEFVEKSYPEEDFELVQYESTFADFDELAIQYGFVTLFVVAFPLAPVFALLNNLLEVKVDSMKLVSVTRRPEPRGAYSIGTWYDIFSTISYISIVTNIIICIWYTDEIENWVDANEPSTSAVSVQVWATVIAEHFIILVKFAVGYFIPDQDTHVTQHLARQRYLVDILLNGAVEEEEDTDLLRRSLDAVAPGERTPEMEKFDLESIPTDLDYEHCKFTKDDCKPKPEPKEAQEMGQVPSTHQAAGDV